MKRDLKPRLDKLERRTMKAIDDLLREKILAEEEEEEEEEEEQ